MTSSLAERFESKAIRTVNGCWEWQGAMREGYGVILVDGRLKPAHQVSYELYVGPIPEGKELDHLCRNHPCVRPRHLEPVTRSENILRGNGPEVTRRRHKAVTHCPKGHEYTPENTYLYKHPKGYTLRDCRACTNERRQLVRLRGGK